MTASPFSLPPCRSLLALRIHHRLHRHTRHRYGRYRPGDPVSLFPARARRLDATWVFCLCGSGRLFSAPAPQS